MALCRAETGRPHSLLSRLNHAGLSKSLSKYQEASQSSVIFDRLGCRRANISQRQRVSQIRKGRSVGHVLLTTSAVDCLFDCNLS